MASIIEYLSDKTTKLILYTYDSLLFDVPINEARVILPKLQEILTNGDFPVKLKYGNIYSKLKNVS
jgi:hypothetical protein